MQKTFFSEGNMCDPGPEVVIGVMKLKGRGNNALREDGVFKV